MNLRRILDWVFPYIEPLTPAQHAQETQRLQTDIAAINAANWSPNEERALDEAQKVATAEIERVRTAEGKATTYLAVLAALVPVIITLQAANWEKKAGPAPDAARLFVLAVATIYVAAAGFHAFKTLQVQGFQKVGESEIAAAWKTPNPVRKLTRGTLLATRNSRDAVNAKITRIRVTHEHLLRAFGTFVLLLLLDPLFYALGFRNTEQVPAAPKVVVVPGPPVIAPPELKCTIIRSDGVASGQGATATHPPAPSLSDRRLGHPAKRAQSAPVCTPPVTGNIPQPDSSAGPRSDDGEVK